jgi:hypothetical protein
LSENTQDQERRDTDTDSTQDAAEPSPASAGSQNTHMATARLSAANTWLQEEIKRLRLTDEEWEAVEWFATFGNSHLAPMSNKWSDHAATLRSLLSRRQ